MVQALTDEQGAPSLRAMSESDVLSVVVLCEVMNLEDHCQTRPQWASEKAESDLDWMQSQGEKFYGQAIGRDGSSLWMAFREADAAMTFATGVQDGLVMAATQMPAEEVLDHRMAMVTGEVGEDASLDAGAIATLRTIIAGADSADIVMTGAVHQLVESILFSPAELGATVEVADAVERVATFFLRSDKPADATSVRRAKVPEPTELEEEAPVARTEESAASLPSDTPVAPADFAAASSIIKPAPVRLNRADLKPRRKTSAKPPEETDEQKPVVFQRIRADRAACNAPYGKVFLAVRDALRRSKIKIRKQDAQAGRFDIKTSWFGKRPVYVSRQGIAFIVTVDKPGEDKVPGKAAKLIDVLCAQPIPAEALPVEELEALRDVEPTP